MVEMSERRREVLPLRDRVDKMVWKYQCFAVGWGLTEDVFEGEEGLGQINYKADSWGD